MDDLKNAILELLESVGSMSRSVTSMTQASAMLMSHIEEQGVTPDEPHPQGEPVPEVLTGGVYEVVLKGLAIWVREVRDGKETPISALGEMAAILEEELDLPKESLLSDYDCEGIQEPHRSKVSKIMQLIMQAKSGKSDPGALIAAIAQQVELLMEVPAGSVWGADKVPFIDVDKTLERCRHLESMLVYVVNTCTSAPEGLAVTAQLLEHLEGLYTGWLGEDISDIVQRHGNVGGLFHPPPPPTAPTAKFINKPQPPHFVALRVLGTGRGSICQIRRADKGNAWLWTSRPYVNSTLAVRDAKKAVDRFGWEVKGDVEGLYPPDPDEG